MKSLEHWNTGTDSYSSLIFWRIRFFILHNSFSIWWKLFSGKISKRLKKTFSSMGSANIFTFRLFWVKWTKSGSDSLGTAESRSIHRGSWEPRFWYILVNSIWDWIIPNQTPIYADITNYGYIFSQYIRAIHHYKERSVVLYLFEY